MGCALAVVMAPAEKVVAAMVWCVRAVLACVCMRVRVCVCVIVCFAGVNTVVSLRKRCFLCRPAS